MIKSTVANFGKAIVIWLTLQSSSAYSQTNQGCLVGGFGVNSSIYAGVSVGSPTPPAGTVDWFRLNTGRSVIVQETNLINHLSTLLSSNLNPVYSVRMNGNIGSTTDIVSSVEYKQLIDAVWARDHFGGSGALDSTAYTIASKNAQDPQLWGAGTGNVLGKNDIIDLAGHMFRDINTSQGLNNLWFVGLINRAEPGGEAYMDFEFFIRDVAFNPSSKKFTSGGPEMGHTAFRFDTDGKIIQLGDMIYNTILTNGGSSALVEVRIWVSRTDYNAFRIDPRNLPFVFGPDFDGPSTGSPYGYASIVALNPTDICGYVNVAGQNPAVPPWGSRNTKSNSYTTSTYLAYSITEVGLNLTGIGLDSDLVRDSDPCSFPWRTFMVKTRTSASFTSALKDFAGPYTWGQAFLYANSSNPILSCANPVVTLTADPVRTGSTYEWTTNGGNIIGSAAGASVQVNKAGDYFVQETTAEGCIYNSPAYVVTAPANPLITGITATSGVSCSGNDGSINISVTGGTAPFTYAWTGPGNYASTTKDLTGLVPGSYTVTVSDVHGCSFTGAPVVVAAKTPVTYASEITHINCYGNNNGSILLTNLAGGIAPLSYSWSNGKTTQNLLNVAAGNYTLTITDGVGCQTNETFIINQPSSALSATLVKSNDTDRDPSVGNGSITLNVSGGTPGYICSWTGPSDFTSTEKDISALKYGSYTVVIADSRGCTYTASAFIYEPEICFDGIDNDGDGLTDCQDTDCLVDSPEIMGQEIPCVGDIVVYTVASPVEGLFYYWTYPSNVTDVTGQGSHTLSLKWQSTSPGQICVRAASAGPVPESKTGQVVCYSQSACVTVSPGDDPQTPQVIQLGGGNNE